MTAWATWGSFTTGRSNSWGGNIYVMVTNPPHTTSVELVGGRPSDLSKRVLCQNEAAAQSGNVVAARARCLRRPRGRDCATWPIPRRAPGRRGERLVAGLHRLKSSAGIPRRGSRNTQSCMSGPLAPRFIGTWAQPRRFPVAIAMAGRGDRSGNRVDRSAHRAARAVVLVEAIAALNRFRLSMEPKPEVRFMSTPTADIGAGRTGTVMGENLVLNMESHGFPWRSSTGPPRRWTTLSPGAARARRSSARLRIDGRGRCAEAAAQDHADGQGGQGRWTTSSSMLLPHLEPGDIIIDGGNSHFPDTIRRTKYLESKGMLYVGTGVSRRRGRRALRPVHDARRQPAAWPQVKDIFQAICRQNAGRRAVLRLGGRGRRRPLRQDGPQRHRVRRHAAHLRGLQLLKERPGHDARGDARGFRRMEQGRTRHSYLIEITRDILGLQGRRRRARWWTRSSTPPGRRAPASGR